MHRTCTHTWWRLRHRAGLKGAAPRPLDNLWTRLHRGFGTGEQCFPAGGMPGVTAIVG